MDGKADLTIQEGDFFRMIEAQDLNSGQLLANIKATVKEFASKHQQQEALLKISQFRNRNR